MKEKKKQAYMKLLIPTTISVINGAIPKPTAEVPAELVTAASDVVVFIDIWNTYFGEDMSTEDIKYILKRVGILKSVGNSLIYVGVKVADGVINEIGNFLGPAGWMVEGLLSGSISFGSGYMWIRFCEKLYLEHGENVTYEVLKRGASSFDVHASANSAVGA